MWWGVRIILLTACPATLALLATQLHSPNTACTFHSATYMIDALRSRLLLEVHMLSVVPLGGPNPEGDHYRPVHPLFTSQLDWSSSLLGNLRFTKLVIVVLLSSITYCYHHELNFLLASSREAVLSLLQSALIIYSRLWLYLLATSFASLIL